MNAADLYALLADPALAGAYFVDAGDRAAISAAGSALGFAVLAVDLRGCVDKAQVLERFATALRFPDWFGDN
ncbi:MAG: barstar family protein [Gammaproteobacteria bacterium]|nr:barstar family protein [Gammaproteobacteria bacterium]